MRSEAIDRAKRRPAPRPNLLPACEGSAKVTGVAGYDLLLGVISMSFTKVAFLKGLFAM